MIMRYASIRKGRTWIERLIIDRLSESVVIILAN